MRGRVVVDLAPVMGASDDRAGREVHDDRADGNVVVLQRKLGFVERGAHPTRARFGVGQAASSVSSCGAPRLIEKPMIGKMITEIKPAMTSATAVDSRILPVSRPIAVIATISGKAVLWMNISARRCRA